MKNKALKVLSTILFLFIVSSFGMTYNRGGGYQEGGNLNMGQDKITGDPTTGIYFDHNNDGTTNTTFNADGSITASSMTVTDFNVDSLSVTYGISAATGVFSGAIEAATLNTGQGANELYAMNQDVETSDNVIFASMSATADLYVAGTAQIVGDTDIIGALTVGSLTTPYQETVIVAKSGGDYTSVQSAIDSISDAAVDKRYCIFVYPGIYDEVVTMIEFVDLIGTDRDACVIKQTDASILIYTGNNYIANLTLNLILPTAARTLIYGDNISTKPTVLNNLYIKCDDANTESITGISTYGSSGSTNLNITNCEINILSATGGCIGMSSTAHTGFIENCKYLNAVGTGFIDRNGSVVTYNNCYSQSTAGLLVAPNSGSLIGTSKNNNFSTITIAPAAVSATINSYNDKIGTVILTAPGGGSSIFNSYGSIVTNITESGAGGTETYNAPLTATSIAAADSGGLLFEDDGGTDAMFIEDGGNIGIGTIAPTEVFEVLGNIKSTVNGDGRIQITDVSSDTIVNLDSNGASYLNGGNFGLGIATPGNTLDVRGSASFDQYTVISATHSLATDEYFLDSTYSDTAVSSITLTTAALTPAGRIVVIKDAGFNASNNNIYILTEGAETIDEAAVQIISTDGSAIVLHTDGDEWFIH